MDGQFPAKTGLFNQESIEPGGIDFPEAAVLGGDVQPLIDKGLQRACRAPRSTPQPTRKSLFTFKNGAQRKFTGKSLLLTFSVPQFFFHVTTAYDILRHAGVDIAKKDFLGPPR